MGILQFNLFRKRDQKQPVNESKTKPLNPHLHHLWERNPMKFRPLGDRVLVRRVDEETKTKGGIIIPDTAKEKPQEGEVVAVGTGARAENGTITPMDVKVGDRVLMGKYSGSEVKIDDHEYTILREDEILAVIAR